MAYHISMNFYIFFLVILKCFTPRDTEQKIDVQKAKRFYIVKCEKRTFCIY